jgi:hypothetical protein
MQNQSSKPPDDSFTTGAAWGEFLADLMGRTLIVWLRHDFGERYFSIVGCYSSILTFVVFFIFAGLVSIVANASSPLLSIYFYLFIVTCIVHQWLIRLRRIRKAPHIYSHYAGSSWLYEWGLIPASHRVTQLYVEPAIGIVGGWFISLIDNPLGTWIMVSGVGLWFSEAMKDSRWRNRVLDVLDEGVLAEGIRKAILEQKDPSETHGIPPIPIVSSLPREQQAYIARRMGGPSLEDAIRQLSPELQSLLNRHSEEDSGSFLDTDEPANPDSPSDPPPKRGPGRPKKPTTIEPVSEAGGQ